jgi:hypothetical protein
MQTITKTELAIVTVTSQAAHDWIEEYASVDWIDGNSFTMDAIFLAELVESMADDGLQETVDYEVMYK